MASRIAVRPAGKRGSVVGATLLALSMLTACDLSVTNPGPVQDENLDNPAAFEGLVNGGMRMVLLGWAKYAHQMGALVREFQTTGAAGSDQIQHTMELGLDLLEQRWLETPYALTQEGRWVSEHAIERLRAVLGGAADSNAFVGRAYLWAGVGNRVLGEHMCTAIINGGAPEPYLSHFTRAVEQFNQAERIAAAARDEQTRMAAIALRAAAHVHLGNWTAAVTDATKIPADFTFAGQFYDREAEARVQEDLRYTGERYDPASKIFGRSLSFWSTRWESYFTATGDPRVAWGYDTRNPVNALRSSWGNRPPVYYPLKFYAPRGPTERTAFAPNSILVYAIPVNLATGREMQLIRAEAALQLRQAAGITEAMQLINAVRQRQRNYFTAAPLAAATATTLEDAWTALKLERFAELSLEGRRVGDRKRWAVNKTPGRLDPTEYMPDVFVRQWSAPREPPLCAPLPKPERDRNPSVPSSYVDPRING